jgi:hypothetical protein
MEKGKRKREGGHVQQRRLPKTTKSMDRDFLVSLRSLFCLSAYIGHSSVLQIFYEGECTILYEQKPKENENEKK